MSMRLAHSTPPGGVWLSDWRTRMTEVDFQCEGPKRRSGDRLIAASCSCDAPAASSASAAICSIDLRNCSAAAEASVSPLANSSVAAATRSNRASAFPTPAFRAAAGGWASGAWFDELRIVVALIARTGIFELARRAAGVWPAQDDLQSVRLAKGPRFFAGVSASHRLADIPLACGGSLVQGE